MKYNKIENLISNLVVKIMTKHIYMVVATSGQRKLWRQLVVALTEKYLIFLKLKLKSVKKKESQIIFF